jgi:hypothetical protein
VNMVKKVFLLWMIVGFTVVLSACSASSEVFEASGITIELSDDFIQGESLEFPMFLESKNHMFVGLRESKVSLRSYGIDNLQEYIDAVVDNAGGVDSDILTFDENGIQFTYAYYTREIDGRSFGYMLVIKEGTSHYYTMNFFCVAKNLEKSKSMYMDWAKTITVQ